MEEGIKNGALCCGGASWSVSGCAGRPSANVLPALLWRCREKGAGFKVASWKYPKKGNQLVVSLLFGKEARKT
jgi:hypothetical protein